jgi:hypothetical protein
VWYLLGPSGGLAEIFSLEYLCDNEE